jgi:hypothetical protein
MTPQLLTTIHPTNIDKAFACTWLQLLGAQTDVTILYVEHFSSSSWNMYFGMQTKTDYTVGPWAHPSPCFHLC